MTFATILANPKDKNLTQSSIDDFAKNCEHVITTKILEQGIAAEVEFEGECPAALDGFDVIIQARKNIKLLVCDMESTIIDNEFLDDIAEHLGIGIQVASITKRAMNNEINFEQSLQQRMALVLGLKHDDAMQLMREKLKYNSGAKELISFCRANGIYTMLVSGGFTIFTEIVKNELGFDEHHANKLIFKDGILAGVEPPFLGRAAKLTITNAKVAKMGISLEEVAAIGDGANDLDMLEAVGLPIAFRAKPALKARIKNQFNHSDLRGLTYLLTAN
jgi:phosphoserine phosphatase